MNLVDIFEAWSEKYKRSINCSNPKGFSQRAHCQGRKKTNEGHEQGHLTLVNALEDFLPLAMQHLNIDKLPRITFRKDVEGKHAPTFGKFDNNDVTIFVDIENRHPNDVLRTLAHELTHFRQYINGELDERSGETGTPVENEANATAGIIMREFNQKYPHYLNLEPVKLP